MPACCNLSDLSISANAQRAVGVGNFRSAHSALVAGSPRKRLANMAIFASRQPSTVFTLVASTSNSNSPTASRKAAPASGALSRYDCGCAMTPSYSSKNGKIRYRYYTCTKAQKQGWDTCPSKSIPAGQIEQFVVDRIRSIGTDPGLQDEVVQIISRHHEE